MAKAKIKLDRGLYERLRQAAEQAGYATTEEFVIHVLERETERLERSADDAQVDEQLKGLGYLD